MMMVVMMISVEWLCQPESIDPLSSVPGSSVLRMFCEEVVGMCSLLRYDVCLSVEGRQEYREVNALQS